MVLFGSFDDIEKKFRGQFAKELFTYLRGLSADMVRSMVGPEDLGHGITIIPQIKQLGPREFRVYESHKKFVDIHHTLDGEELIESNPVGALHATTSYDETDDYVLYDNSVKGEELLVKSRHIAIFLPEEGHMPGIRSSAGNSEAIKVVVKYPFSLLKLD